MDNWRTILQKMLSRFWIPALAVVAGLVAWQLFRILPMWVEEVVKTSLRKEEIVVTEFPVEKISFGQTVVGGGSLLYGVSALDWDAIYVDYSLKDLLSGQAGAVVIEAPELSINWSPLPVDALIPAPVAPGGIAPRPSGQARSTEIISGELSEEKGMPVAAGMDDIWDILHQLPFDSLSIQDGVVDLKLREETEFSTSIEGRIEKQPFGVSADLFIDSPSLTSHISLRSPADERVTTVQTGLSMPYNSVRNLSNRLFDQMEFTRDFPRISSSGALTIDLFMEQSGQHALNASTEASMDELSVLIPGTQIEITLDEILAAGFATTTSFNLEGGADVLIPARENFSVEPFGMRVSLKNSTLLSMETEVFEWKLNNIIGRCALIGRADLKSYPDSGWGSLEASFSKFYNDRISVEPFSIQLFQSEDAYSFEASPLGLLQSGTLWIEDLKGSIDSTMERGRGEFAWYGLSGESLGSGALSFSIKDNSKLYEYALSDQSGSPQLKGTLMDSAGKYALQMTGNLHLPWLNALAGWFGYGSYSLQGVSPHINTQLNFQYPLLSGFVDLVLQGLDISMGNGLVVDDITGNHKFAVMIMPRSLGVQETRIAKLSNGPISLENIYIQWELRSIRELVISKFTAQIGEGIIELKPFTLDPFNPDLETTVFVRKFDADLLRQWLKEDRFSIDATIVGQIPVGWKAGELLFGTGKFTLDTQRADNRLKFENRQFLQQKFASLGGVPADLKERLLNALWNNGILMKSMEVYLGPTEKEGEISFRIAVNGETGNELIEFPIGRFVLNNLISLEDLAILMNMVAPVRIDPTLGSD